MPIPPKKQSLFPDYPRSPIIADKSGMLTNDYSLFLSLLSQGLQKNFKNEGILFPSLNATEIAQIEAIYTPFLGSPLPLTLPDISGQSIFDSTNRVPKVFIITYDGLTPPNILTAAWKTYVLI